MAAYDLTNPTALRQQVLLDWEHARPALQMLGPYFNVLENQAAESLGLVPLGSYAQQQESLDLAQRGIGPGNPLQFSPGVPLQFGGGPYIPFAPMPSPSADLLRSLGPLFVPGAEGLRSLR
jgi:hypothetical protein